MEGNARGGDAEVPLEVIGEMSRYPFHLKLALTPEVPNPTSLAEISGKLRGTQ
jgi:hypothetical protein